MDTWHVHFQQPEPTHGQWRTLKLQPHALLGMLKCQWQCASFLAVLALVPAVVLPLSASQSQTFKMLLTRPQGT